ncbi:MAG: TolC family protein [Gammaproteobacteria bacterium]|nr:TolC family protein [Gammaproteobacteria bacterium]
MTMSFKLPYWLAAPLWAWMAGAGAAPLGFDDALTRALQETPALSASASRIAAARQSAIPAGALPDPQLTLGLANVPIDGADRFSLDSEPMTMRMIGVMQAFPNAAKRSARAGAARGRIGLAEAGMRVVRQTVLRQTAQAWIRRHTAEAQLRHIAALYDENRLFDAAVRARLAGGGGMASDVVLPREEAALIAGREDALNARRAQAIASLRQWIGDAADWPLAGTPPQWPIDHAGLAHRLEQHPELALYSHEARVLDAETDLARAATRPDWRLGVVYQQRGSQFTNMAGIELGFDLPVFASTRQGPQIAARVAARAALDADYQAQLRAHSAELDTDLAEYRRLDRALARQNEVLLPLAQEKVTLMLAAWRGGQGSLAQLIGARRARIDAELKAIELAGARDEMAARLHFTYAQPDESGVQP